MARLSKKQHPGNWGFDGDSVEYFARTDKLFKEIQENSLKVARRVAGAHYSEDATGFVMQFPVADGRAYYLVTKETPLTLQHIPIGDAWQIPPAHLRGITIADVYQQIKQRLFWDKA